MNFEKQVIIDEPIEPMRSCPTPSDQAQSKSNYNATQSVTSGACSS